MELVIFTDENWDENSEFLRVKDLEKVLAECFAINVFSLHLERIEHNCLILHYILSSDIAEEIFPLTREQWMMLTRNGIAKLVCNDYVYLMGRKVHRSVTCKQFVF